MTTEEPPTAAAPAPTYKCAGILVYATDPKTQNLYFLLGKETFDGLWSDFSGGPKPGETMLETAIREFTEETMGLVMPKRELKSELEKDKFAFRLFSDNRVTYVKEIPFQPELPQLFADFREDFIRNHTTPGNRCVELLEKCQIAWFSVNRLCTLIRHDKIAHISAIRLRRFFVYTLQLVLDLFFLRP